MSVNIKQNGSLVKISGSSSWTGTRAEYEAIKDTIPVGSVVNITDDEDAKLVLPSDQQQVYSTNEIQIGTWIDGKPIYRKIIMPPDTIVNSTLTPISSMIWYVENVKDIISFKGSFIYDTTNYEIYIPDTAYAEVIRPHLDTSIHKLGFRYRHPTEGVDVTYKNIKLCVEYTKITD